MSIDIPLFFQFFPKYATSIFQLGIFWSEKPLISFTSFPSLHNINASKLPLGKVIENSSFPINCISELSRLLYIKYCSLQTSFILTVNVVSSPFLTRLVFAPFNIFISYRVSLSPKAKIKAAVIKDSTGNLIFFYV